MDYFSIVEIIKSNVYRCAGKRAAVSFSGGLDSSLITFFAKQNAYVECFCASIINAFDYKNAFESAELLGVKLNIIELSKEEVKKRFDKIRENFDFFSAEVLTPISFVAEKAKQKGFDVLLFGSGTEEIFAGYYRYFKAYKKGLDADAIMRKEFYELKDNDIKNITEVCKDYGVKACFPFYDEKLAELVFSIPIEERMKREDLKKHVLREIAKQAGLPNQIVERKKKALQYGTGVHNVVKDNKPYVWKGRKYGI